MMLILMFLNAREILNVDLQASIQERWNPSCACMSRVQCQVRHTYVYIVTNISGTIPTSDPKM